MRTAPYLRRAVLGLLLLAAPAAADKVDELNQALLTDPSYKVKIQAALVLGKLGDRRAVPALIEALRDSNDTVRGMAAVSLGKLGDARAIDPLERMRNDGSEFVRGNATRALAQLEPKRPHDEGGGGAGAHHYVAIRMNARGGGGSDALRRLEAATREEVAKLPRVTVQSPGSASALQARRMSGWSLEGNLSLRVSGSGSSAQLDCDVSAAIATWPSHSIKATSSAGASIPGVRTANDASAQQQCFQAIAEGLADDLGKFLRTQP